MHGVLEFISTSCKVCSLLFSTKKVHSLRELYLTRGRAVNDRLTG